MLTDAIRTLRRSLRSLVSRRIPRYDILATFLGPYTITSFVSRLLLPLADCRSPARFARLVSRPIHTMRTLPPALDLHYYVSRPIPTTSRTPLFLGFPARFARLYTVSRLITIMSLIPISRLSYYVVSRLSSYYSIGGVVCHKYCFLASLRRNIYAKPRSII